MSSNLRYLAIALSGLSVSLSSFASDSSPSSIAESTDKSMRKAAESSRGFVEDSHLSLEARNFYMNRQYKGQNSLFSTQKRRREWGQGFRAEFSSGFTQGTVGIGFDAFTYTAFRLDSTPAHGGGGALAHGGYGQKARTEFSRGGGAVRLKVSKTTLAYGDMRMDTPYLYTSDDRIFPETAKGFLLTSNEFSGLQLQAAHITAMGSTYSTNNHMDLLSNYQLPPGYGFRRGESLDFYGAVYKPINGLTLTLYRGDYENVWRQYFAEAAYQFSPTGKDMLIVQADVYRTNDAGKAYQGAINNTAWSITGTYARGSHAVILGYQKIHGNEPYDYIGSYSMRLANLSTMVDFNGPGERSYRFGYLYDMTAMGIPGLRLAALYIKGDGIDGSRLPEDSGYRYKGYGKNGKHWERTFQIGYTVQSGKAKGLDIYLRQISHRGNSSQPDADMDEFRLVTSYKVDLF